MKKDYTKVELDRVENVVKRYEYVNPKLIADIIGVHYYTARKYLAKLEEKGVVRRMDIKSPVHERYIYEVLDRQQNLPGEDDGEDDKVHGEAQVAGPSDSKGDTQDKGK